MIFFDFRYLLSVSVFNFNFDNGTDISLFAEKRIVKKISIEVGIGKAFGGVFNPVYKDFGDHFEFAREALTPVLSIGSKFYIYNVSDFHFFIMPQIGTHKYKMISEDNYNFKRENLEASKNTIDYIFKGGVNLIQLEKYFLELSAGIQYKAIKINTFEEVELAPIYFEKKYIEVHKAYSKITPIISMKSGFYF